MSNKNKNQKRRQIAQVSSESLIPPTESTNAEIASDADEDFAKEEKALAEQMKALKAKQAALNKRRRIEVGGKKLAKMRKYAEEAVLWAISATDKACVSVKRANDAVAKLDEYEDKLGIPVPKRVGEKLTEQMVLLTEATDVIVIAKS